MPRREVTVMAIEKRITWIAAAQIIGVTDRQMRRLKGRYEQHGYDDIVDQRGSRSRRHKIAMETIERICRLNREKYAARDRRQ